MTSTINESRRQTELDIARDGVATRVFLQPIAAPSVLGLWFFALGAITASGFLASLAESLGLAAVLGTLAAGSGIAAGAFIYGSHGWVQVAGWLFVISAGCAWYVATAMMLAAAGGMVVLPLGKYSRAANVPGRKPTRPIELEWAEPGVKMGQ